MLNASRQVKGKVNVKFEVDGYEQCTTEWDYLTIYTKDDKERRYYISVTNLLTPRHQL